MPQQDAVASARLVDALFADAGVGLCLVAPDGSVVRANAEWLRFVGRDRDRVIGRGVEELLPAGGEALAAIRAHARSGRRVEIPRHLGRPSGRETRWEGSVSPVSMDEGTGLLIVAREVPDGAHAWHAYGQARGTGPGRRFDAYFSHAAVGAVELDLEGRFQVVNDRFCEIVGYAREELLRMTPLDLLLPEDRARCAAGAGRKREEVFDEEVRHVRKDGDVIWVRVTAGVIRDPDGRSLRCAAIVEDVSERRRAEQALHVANEQLRLADRRKNEFIAMLSHELRNPLAPIRNGIHLLERFPADSAQAARARQVVLRQAEQLTRLVDDLLDVSRISRGKLQLRRAVVDLAEVVNRACEDHRSLIEQSGLELRLDVAAGPVWADADPSRIAQVLENLLDNANKFTPAGGVVTVELRAAGERAEVRVRDTGMGIEPSRLERIFEPFTQEARGLARSPGGLGLGLALSKGILELHGGTIQARSEGAGSGSEVVVTLPLAAPDALHVNPVPEAAVQRPSRSVLIVEDNADAAETLGQVLELEGHRVRIARDGTTGIALAREVKPDVVLCDIGLPDVDGYEVARTLRRDRSLRATRLIAVSGYAQAEDKLRAREAGFDGHLGKPTRVSDVIAMLA